MKNFRQLHYNDKVGDKRLFQKPSFHGHPKFGKHSLSTDTGGHDDNYLIAINTKIKDFAQE